MNTLPLQLHEALHGDLYCSLHLWSDLWLGFCTCHLKLEDTHKASVIVCLPELALDNLQVCFAENMGTNAQTKAFCSCFLKGLYCLPIW